MAPDFVHIKDYFNTAARHARKEHVNGFVARIRDARPDLHNHDAFVPTEGQSAITVMIGDEVFKTPYNVIVHGKNFARELKVMEIMTAQKTPFVPHLTYTAPDRSFFSISRTHGVTLNATIPHMNTHDLDLFAQDIGHARAQMDHTLTTITLPDIKEYDFAAFHTPTTYMLKSWDTPHVQKAINHIDGDLHDAMIAYHAHWAQGRHLFSHVDLHAFNVIMNPETKRLAGFIDFSHAIQNSFPEVEFKNLPYLIKNKDNSIDLKAYTAYSEGTAAFGVRPFDLAAFTAINTFGLWMKNCDGTDEAKVDRCIDNAMGSMIFAHKLMPKKGFTP